MNSQPTKLIAAALFGIIYGFFVLALHLRIGDTMPFRHVENVIYDAIQRQHLLNDDNLDRYQHADLVEALQHVYLIHLDPDMYINKGNELDRLKLDHLLSSIQPLDKVKAIYLDYVYGTYAPDSRRDTILFRTIAGLQSRLVVPFSYSLDTDNHAFEKIDSSAIVCQTDLVHPDWRAGFFGAEPLLGDPRLRYLRLQIPQLEYTSAAFQMALLTHRSQAIDVGENAINRQLEINYVCDNPGLATGAPLKVLHASQLLKGKSTLEQILEGENAAIIFIGQFERHTDLHCMPRNVVPTPINQEMYRTMVTVNAWLNIVTGRYLQTVSNWFVWTLNFCIGFLSTCMGFYFSGGRAKSFGFLAMEGILFVGLWLLLIYVGYQNTTVKLPFALTALIAVRCEWISRQFSRLFNFYPSKNV